MKEPINEERQPHSYAERATAAAHDAVDRVGERAVRAEERLRDTADEIRRKGNRARDRAQEMGDDAAVTARSYLHEHPLASLAAAFGAGVVISALMRR